jgi:hypothetical protein
MIGRGFVENITVRMDSLLPTDFRKRKVIEGGIRRKYYKISIHVEIRVKHAVTLDVKHKNRVIATYTTTSL